MAKCPGGRRLNENTVLNTYKSVFKKPKICKLLKFSMI